MPCSRNHTHDWLSQVPTGILVIERCEHFCGFCTGLKAAKKHKFGWYLRRHVKAVHGKTYPGLEVAEGWTRPDGTVCSTKDRETRASKVTPQRRSTKNASRRTTAATAVTKSSPADEPIIDITTSLPANEPVTDTSATYAAPLPDPGATDQFAFDPSIS